MGGRGHGAGGGKAGSGGAGGRSADKGGGGDSMSNVPDSIGGLTQENVVESLGLQHVPRIEHANVSLRRSDDFVVVEIMGPGLQISRVFDQANKTVDNRTFFLGEGLQGKGIGEKVIRAQMKSYEKMGIKQVELSSAEIGRYVWPKMGFRPSAAVEHRMVSDFKSVHGPSAANVKTVQDIANFKSKDGKKLGKDYLLSKPGEYYRASPSTILNNIGR